MTGMQSIHPVNPVPKGQRSTDPSDAASVLSIHQTLLHWSIEASGEPSGANHNLSTVVCQPGPGCNDQRIGAVQRLVKLSGSILCHVGHEDCAVGCTAVEELLGTLRGSPRLRSIDRLVCRVTRAGCRNLVWAAWLWGLSHRVDEERELGPRESGFADTFFAFLSVFVVFFVDRPCTAIASDGTIYLWLSLRAPGVDLPINCVPSRASQVDRPSSRPTFSVRTRPRA
jgi:hypothetical protein